MSVTGCRVHSIEANRKRIQVATRMYLVGKAPSKDITVAVVLMDILADRVNVILDEHRAAAEEALRLARQARLVEAATQAEAIRHVAKQYTATVASGIQIKDLMLAGVIPEVAGDEPAGEAQA